MVGCKRSHRLQRPASLSTWVVPFVYVLTVTAVNLHRTMGIEHQRETVVVRSPIVKPPSDDRPFRLADTVFNTSGQLPVGIGSIMVHDSGRQGDGERGVLNLPFIKFFEVLRGATRYFGGVCFPGALAM